MSVAPLTLRCPRQLATGAVQGGEARPGLTARRRTPQHPPRGGELGPRPCATVPQLGARLGAVGPAAGLGEGRGEAGGRPQTRGRDAAGVLRGV